MKLYFIPHFFGASQPCRPDGGAVAANPENLSSGNKNNHHIMKKFFVSFALLLFAIATMSAQNAFVGGHRAWTFALEGGPLYSINENGFSYQENGYGLKRISWEGAAAIGYEFTSALGGRIWVGYGGNRGACNTNETAAHGFYPYNFKSLNGFFDVTLDLNGVFGEEHPFRPIFYLGAGIGHTFGFTKPAFYGTPADSTWEPGNPFHPWQDVEQNNTAFGFRGGLIVEYDIKPYLGLFADFKGEAFKDQYNGLQPTQPDQQGYTGYAGFPFDMRFSIQLGIIYRYNY